MPSDASSPVPPHGPSGVSADRSTDAGGDRAPHARPDRQPGPPADTAGAAAFSGTDGGSADRTAGKAGASADDRANGGAAHASRRGGGDEVARSTLELAATLYTTDQLRGAARDLMHDAPQLALAGRSNVGKSSLLNALARRRQLARVSSTPGKTRSINLFLVRPEGFFLTDLPGYGYARRGKEERRQWGELMEQYLLKSANLRAVVLLLDCRLPPQALDRQMADFARAHGLPVLPILTKADKCSQRERSARQKEWSLLLGGKMPLPVSAHTGLGVNALWENLREACHAHEGTPHA